MNSQPNKAFKVFQASAGSGKTFTIVKEYLSLCLRNKAATGNFRHILAITFTNMAANEMKAKIVRQLISIIDCDPTREADGMEALLIEELGISRAELKENAKILFLNIIHNYSDFFICTIDAFVQRLARSFAKDLGLPTQFNVSIDQEEVADSITERIGEQIGVDNPFLNKIVEDFAEKRLEGEKSPKVANEIHGFTETLFAEDAFQKSDDNLFDSEPRYQETLTFLQGKVYPFEAHCHQLVEQFSDFISRNGLTPDDFSGKTRSACLGFLKSLQKKEYPMPTTSLMKIADGEADWYSKSMAKQRGATALQQLNEAFNQVFVHPVKSYQSGIGAYHFYRIQLDKLSLYVLRSKIKAEMEAYIGEEQVVHISEFNKRINTILGDFSVPFIYERMGNRFKHVFIDEFQDTSVLQWQNLIPLVDNSLSAGYDSMVVGDGKQSIYRWRNGEVGQIASLPLIHEKPDASEAFDEFERNLVHHFSFNELSRNYRSFQNIIDFNNDFFASSLGFLDEASRKVYADRNEQFGKEVSIKQSHQHGEPGFVQVELFDQDDNADENMLSRIKELIEDLCDKGFQKNDITILVRKNKTGSLIAEYLNRNGIEVISADSILLKSSNKVRLIIGTLDYLIHPDNPVAMATMNFYWNLVRQERFDGVADDFFNHGPDPECFKPLMAKSYSLYDLCAALMRLYGMDSTGDSYLNFLLNVVYQWQSADEAGIANFLDYWGKKKNSLTVVSGKADAVNVMTIHKSKGLEFNVVICPFVVDNLDDKKPTTIWVAPEELGFEAIPNIEKVQHTLTKESATWSPQAQRVAEQENARVRLDNMNLDYVAFTRAVQRLHILAYKTKTPDKSPLNAFVGSHPEPYGDPMTRKVEGTEKTGALDVLYHESTSSEWLDRISIDPNPTLFWADPNDKMKPQEWGDFVHQILSEINHADDIDRALRPHLDAGVIDQSTADLLKGLFTQMTLNPLLADAFSHQAKVKNECDILLSDGSILRPDRYAEMPDKIYLLDYKTGKPNEEHHRQLRNYVAVLKKMVSKDIEAYLVYLGNELTIKQIQ